jgi:uncharacterized protein YlxP (DUF503 family)
VAQGFVGIMEFEIHLPESGSLKAKRRHVLHTKAQLEHRFGASVAEINHHELWQRAGLAMTVVRRDATHTWEALHDAERYLSAQEYELVSARSRVVSVEEMLE